MPKVVIDPVTRIEGHLRVTCMVEDGKVVDAWNHAMHFRGFEVIMKDRDLRDAWQFMQRICGVCPTPHAHTSVLACEHAVGVDKVPDNARLYRNMLEAAHVGYDHILWFYHLNAFDYVNVPNALNAKPTLPSLVEVQKQVKAVVDSGQLGPFAGHWWDHPGYKLSPELDLELTAHYLQALQAQIDANDAQAVLGGRFPMVMSYMPGGMMRLPTLDEINYYVGQMEKLKSFVDTVMLPDLLAVAPAYIELAESGRGHGNYLSWGIYDDESQVPEDRLIPRGAIFDGDLSQVQEADLDEVRMYTKHSWYEDASGGGKHPLEADPQENIEFTQLNDKENANVPEGKYDWSTAARYGEEARPMEVGPLAEMLVTYVSGQPAAKKLVDDTLKAIGQEGKPQVLMSNLGRIAARVLRAKLNADYAVQWANELLENIGAGDNEIITWPDELRDGEGSGGWNAPRGALAHYVRAKGGRVEKYAAVPPTNWNLSPRDDNDVRGPLEETLIGLPVEDPERPLEILRVTHTFDP